MELFFGDVVAIKRSPELPQVILDLTDTIGNFRSFSAAIIGRDTSGTEYLPFPGTIESTELIYPPDPNLRWSFERIATALQAYITLYSIPYDANALTNLLNYYRQFEGKSIIVPDIT